MVMLTSSNSDGRRDHCWQPTPTPDKWQEAEELIRSQPALRCRLGEVLRSFPATGGLYSDEQEGAADAGEQELRRRGQFADYVGYVRAALAVSPSTVLRRAADASLTELYHSRPKLMGELYDLVGLKRVDAAGQYGDEEGDDAEGSGGARVHADIIALAAAVDRLTKGRLHARWKGALAGMSKPAPWEADGGPEAFRAKIAGGMQAKAKSRAVVVTVSAADGEEGESSTRSARKVSLVPSENDVDAAVRRAMGQFEVRKRRAAAEAARLEADLPSDEEHRRYVRAHELWECETRAKEVWEAYRSADGANLKERRNRGGAFEGDGAALCFAAIALILARKTGQKASSYRYVRGARWREDRRRRGGGGRGGTRWIGEIDLVVLHGDKVAALCEMKSGCFEVASAFAQHEAKLSAALEVAESEPESSLEAQSTIQIVAPDGDLLKLPFREETFLSMASSVDYVPIFVATVLPEHDIIGVEPAMSQAVCDGIRAQGQKVWDRSTEEAARHSALPEPLKIGLPRSSLETIDGESSSVLEDSLNCIDLEELESFVRAQIGQGRESPAGCLARRGERVLVLPPSSIRWQVYSDVK